ncbi:hypothetical protein M8542_13590 [Amycolatopsis sp. OK19-0408]|uniref:Uncharacterized protein n=1 Tax=Amycolatopsis iheyensis TaxID=2945988 RepID=A0A9X2SKH3_9PSEU|nr:hypothetical protein [Amycolatopsis iheyensis]MCR6483851.1 hypothetical protein [Amycolatopsis iheyensis]
MSEHDFTGTDNPVGDLTLPSSTRTGARNRALTGRAPRLSEVNPSTLDITPVFTLAVSE